MPLSNASLALQVSELVAYWRLRDVQFADWLSGSADGGPFSDGRYPLTDYLGVIQYLACPAALEAGVSGSSASAIAAQTAAEAAQVAASAAKVAAELARDYAATYRTAAEAARDLAFTYRNAAEGFRATTLTYRNAARDWASKASGEVVADGLYSARHYAEAAAASAASMAQIAYIVQDDAEVHYTNADFVRGQNVIGVRYEGPATVYIPHDLAAEKLISVKDEAGSGDINISVY